MSASYPNIDFVDAALCAVATHEFRHSNYQRYGNSHERFMVAPASSVVSN